MSSTVANGRGEVFSAGPSRQVVLNSREDLVRFRMQLHVLRALPPAAIRIGTGVALAPDRASFEERLNSLYSDCGCTAGSIAATATFGSATWIARAKRTVGFTFGLRTLAAVLATALVGKLAGLTYSRIALIRLVRHAESSLALEGPNGQI